MSLVDSFQLLLNHIWVTMGMQGSWMHGYCHLGIAYTTYEHFVLNYKLYPIFGRIIVTIHRYIVNIDIHGDARRPDCWCPNWSQCPCSSVLRARLHCTLFLFCPTFSSFLVLSLSSFYSLLLLVLKGRDCQKQVTWIGSSKIHSFIL